MVFFLQRSPIIVLGKRVEMNRIITAVFLGILTTGSASGAEDGSVDLPKSAFGYKSVSIDEDLEVFSNSEDFSCKGSAQGFAYCRPQENNEIFKTYAGTKLSSSHIEFLDGKVSKYYLAIRDCGYWNYLGGESYDQDCLVPVISAMQRKYGTPKSSIIRDNAVVKGGYVERELLAWDLGAVEITLETLSEIGETALYYKGYKMEGMGNIDRANIIEIRHKLRAGEIDKRILAAQKAEMDKKEEIEREKKRKHQAQLAAERDDL